METIGTSSPKPGLRERKKQQTRDTIARVALELFAEHGYDETTLAEIAEAANVSPRTIFAYFQSKEDILFCDDESSFVERVKRTLEERPPGTTTVDAIRDLISSVDPADDLARLRKQIIGSSESLRRSEHARSAPIEELLAQSIARDLDAGPGDVRPWLVAASIRAAATAARERMEAESGDPITQEQAIGIVDQVLDFLRGGLDALQRAQDTPERRT